MAPLDKQKRFYLCKNELKNLIIKITFFQQTKAYIPANEIANIRPGMRRKQKIKQNTANHLYFAEVLPRNFAKLIGILRIKGKGYQIKMPIL